MSVRADPEDMNRHVGAAQCRPDPFSQLFIGRPDRPSLLFEEGGHDLAVLLILETDDAGLGDGWMLAEPLLDLERVDVLST